MQKNSYNFPVEFINDPFGETPELAKLVEGRRVFIVADANVVQRVSGLGLKIGRYVQERGLQLAGSPVVLVGGEKTKVEGLENAKRIVTAALDAKIGHNDVLLALGGGAVLDVAGYAAAQLRGGVQLLRMPTTPAAMMDVAFATSAAINYEGIKDALSVPCVPMAVVIDPAFAERVTDGVWNAGFCETLRLAWVQDATLLKKLLKLLPDYRARKLATLTEVVKGVVAARLKKGTTGFGLWAADRLEAMSDYRLPHGYAVAIGMLIDTAYAVKKEYLKPEQLTTLVKVLQEGGALDGLAHSHNLLTQVESLLKGVDSKRLATGASQVTVPTGLGKSVTEELDREAMRQVIVERKFGDGSLEDVK